MPRKFENFFYFFKEKKYVKQRYMNYNVIEIENKKKKAEMEEKKNFFCFFIVCKTDREYRCFGQRKKKLNFLREKKEKIKIKLRKKR